MIGRLASRAMVALGKCHHCGSGDIRRRYRRHRRYNWRCRKCNKTFVRPKTLSIRHIAGIAIVIAALMAGAFWLYSQQGSTSELALLDEASKNVAKAPPQTATAESVGLTTRTPFPLAARPDMPTVPAPPALTRTPTPTSTPVLTGTLSPTSTTTATTSVPTYAPEAIHTVIPTHTETPMPTSPPIPIRTPKPTTTTAPKPTQIPGRADLYDPIHPPNHMAAVQWTWGSRYDGFQSIDFDLTIHNDVDAGNLLPHYGLYLMLDSSDISGTGYYFGLQTDVQDPISGRGRGKGLIFSRWGTRDLSNVRVAPDGWYQSSGHEGDFVGVRKAYNWGAGDYRARIAADGEDDEGRWFGLWITDKATGETAWCGSLRFPYENGKALLENNHVNVVEIYGDPVSIKPIDIPEWHITLQKPIADDGRLPADAYISYTNYDGRPSAPNSSVEFDSKEGSMHIFVGGTTQRRTEEGWISLEVK